MVLVQMTAITRLVMMTMMMLKLMLMLMTMMMVVVVMSVVACVVCDSRVQRVGRPLPGSSPLQRHGPLLKVVHVSVLRIQFLINKFLVYCFHLSPDPVETTRIPRSSLF